MAQLRNRPGTSVTGVLVALLFVLAGCQGGGPGEGLPDAGETPSTPTPVSAEARQATFEAVHVKLAEWDALPREERNTRLVALLSARPEVAEAGVSVDGSVWARFVDERYYVINDGLAPPTPTTGTQAPKPSRTSAAAAPVELPRGKRAYLLTSVVDSFGGLVFPLEDPPNGDLEDMLEEKGYTVARHDADVEFLKGLRDVAVLHWSAHGALADTSRPFFSVFTSTPFTPQLEQTYQQDLTAGRLVYFSAITGYTANVARNWETHFAITDKFVQHYGWTFTPDSFAFLNFCWSEAGGFAGALRTLAQPVTVTAGWSNAAAPISAWKAARFMFDRLLGTHQAEPKEPTPQRPFDVEAVYGDMQKRGLTDATSPEYGTAHLLVTDQPASPASISLTRSVVLAPSIATMDVQERVLEQPKLRDSRMVLHGLFGGEPGEVTIGGEPVLGIVSWERDKVEVRIAEEPGPGFAGNVQVKSAHGVTSNVVPLTWWQGRFTYSARPFGPALDTLSVIDLDVTFRADVHPYRTEPGGALKKQGPKYFRAALGSTGRWAMQGSPPSGVWVKREATLPYGLHGNTFPEHAPYGTGYILEGTLSPEAGTLALAVDFLGCVATYRVEGAQLPDYNVATPRDSLLLAQHTGAPDGLPIPQVMGVLNEDFSLAAGNASGMTAGTFDARVQWNALVPAFAPEPEDGEDVP